jgi:hypothetical protein
MLATGGTIRPLGNDFGRKVLELRELAAIMRYSR